MRRLLVLAVAGATVVAGIGVSVLATPSYRAEARVLIENLETSYDRSENETVIASRVLDETELGSQVQVLASGDIGRRALKELAFPAGSEFSGSAASVGTVARLLIAVGLKADPDAESEQQRALAKYRRSLTVYPVPQSRVIAIRFSAADPRTAAMVANKVAEVYVSATREVQNENMARSRVWLGDEIERLRAKLATAETAVEQFRIEHGLLKGTEDTLAAQELSELSSQMTLAETAQAELEAKAKVIRDMLKERGTVDASAPVLDSTLMQRLREQQIALSREQSELAAVYLGNHPKMIAARHDLAELEQAVRDEAMKLVLAAESQAQTAAARVDALRSRFEALKAEAGEANRDEVRLRALEREAAASKTILETYMSRLTDANARGTLAAQPGVARVIEQAEVPASPYFPKRGPLIVISAAGGLFLGIGLAFMATVMGSSESPRRPASTGTGDRIAPPTQPPSLETSVIRQLRPPPRTAGGPGDAADPAEGQRPAEPLCEVDACGTVAQARLQAATTFARPGTGYALAIRPMVGWILDLRQTQGARRVLVTGIGYERLEAAAVALALGRGLAFKGMKTILIDSDSESRALDLGLGDRPRPTGEGGGPIPADSVVKEVETGLHILKAALNPAALTATAMGKIVETLERSYDLVVMHGAPASPANAAAWDRFQIGVVVASGRFMREAGATIDMLRSAGLRAVKSVRTRDSHVQIGMNRAEGK
jgi:uncharacterized protein involved in exopolysaccharide biosynthesis